MENAVKETKSKMLKAAQETNFMEAAKLRYEMYELQEKYKARFGEELTLKE